MTKHSKATYSVQCWVTKFVAPTISSPAPASLFSHGFLRLDFIGREACPWSTVSGTSLIPSIGSPLVMSWTISLNDFGYGAVASSPREAVSLPLREVESRLGGLRLTDEGADAGARTDMPLGREDDD